jgi:hypothetical protein
LAWTATEMAGLDLTVADPQRGDQTFNYTGSAFTIGASGSLCLSAPTKAAGALLKQAPCSRGPSQVFSYNASSGHILTTSENGADQLCVDSGPNLKPQLML